MGQNCCCREQRRMTRRCTRRRFAPQVIVQLLGRMHPSRWILVASWLLIAGTACIPCALTAQGPVLGATVAHYQFGTATSRGGRERVWTLGVRVGLPVGRNGELGLAAERSFLRNQSQGPSVFALRTELQYGLRSPPPATVWPHVVAGLGMLHFQSNALVFSATCPFVCVTAPGYSSSGWQVTGSAGLGLTLQLSPMLWLAPRVEGVLPLWRLSGGSEAAVYVRWSLALAWRM